MPTNSRTAKLRLTDFLDLGPFSNYVGKARGGQSNNNDTTLHR